MELITLSNFLLAFLSVSMIGIIAVEKYRTHEITRLMVSRNVALGEQLDILRTEIKLLNSELIALVRENHLLSLEVQYLASEVSKLREDMNKKDVVDSFKPATTV